jgi:hypothetical protein
LIHNSMENFLPLFKTFNPTKNEVDDK